MRNPKSGASCHYLIGKDGRIVQLVREEDAAWHAGRSRWPGWDIRDPHEMSVAVKRRSIGIELENLCGVRLRDKKGRITGVHGPDPYPEAQIEALVWLYKDIASRYPVMELTRHLDIAPGRKSDPAHFDWYGFLARLNA